MSSRIYQNVLRCAKTIDGGNSALKLAFRGLPTQMYSYNWQKNIDIGGETYTGFNQYLKNCINPTEYPLINPQHHSVESIVESYHSDTTKQERNYNKQTVRELELLAQLAHKFPKDTADQHSDGRPILQHIDATTIRTLPKWKGSLLLQHPMSATQSSAAVLLGIDLRRETASDDPVTGQTRGTVPY
eukprot:131863_1